MNASFSYARQVEPLTGAITHELRIGVEGQFRVWTLNDREEFPQALRQTAADCCLVVDQKSGSVYEVAVNEAVAAGLPVDTVEVVEGEFVRADAI